MTISPLVIYDFRVLAHMVFNAREALNKKSTFQFAAVAKVAEKAKPQLRALNSLQQLSYLESNTEPELTNLWLQETKKLYEDYPKIAWALMLNRGPNAVDYQPHTAIIVDDNGAQIPYWRKQLFPDYKGNRSQKPDSFYSVAQQGLLYATNPKSPFLYLTKPAYEADDLAGAMVKIKRLCQSYLAQGQPSLLDYNLSPSNESKVKLIANRDIWLYTVDSDWLQLVGNGVTWYNTGPWEPRVRGPQEAIVWAKKRLKVDLQSPEQIVDTKMRQGDKSDNLPPGSPRYLIDLMNIHKDWELSTRHPDFYNQLWFVMTQTEPNQVMKHYQSARTWFLSNNIPMPV